MGTGSPAASRSSQQRWRATTLWARAAAQENISVWYFQGHIRSSVQFLDRVGQGQKMTMKKIRGLENITDEERLKEMGLCRWKRAD